MYKFYNIIPCGIGTRMQFKFLIIMKLTCILLITTFMHTYATTYAQKVSLNKDNVSLKEVLTKSFELLKAQYNQK